RGVAHELQPDLVAQPLLHRRLQPAGLEGLADAQAAFADRPVRLADREARALDVADHAGLDDLRRRVDHAADDRLGRDRAADRAAGIDGFENGSVEWTPVRLEVPP